MPHIPFLLDNHNSLIRFLVLSESSPNRFFLFLFHMAKAARLVISELKSIKPDVRKVRGYDPTLSGKFDNVKILLQPRVCTLRSYGSDPVGVIKKGMGSKDEVSTFFAMLSEYIDSSRKTQDFEIISGRFAMVVFAATVIMEAATGNSVFKKTDVQGIAEAIGVCMGAVACAASFAWFSSARGKVGRIFTLKCNTFIDALIDQIVDGLFFETELSDWTDDI